MILTPHISEVFAGTIWRMEIDQLSDTLFVEVRNNDEKQVNFSSINLTTGKIGFQNITSPERWLTGIETAYSGVLLLHNYQSDTSPVHRGLTAIDAFTGEMLWSNYSNAFDHLSLYGTVLYDSRIQPRRLFLADIKTGATIRSYQPSVDTELNNNIVIPEVSGADLLALKFSLAHPYGNMAHYLEYNNFRIVSLHAPGGGALIQTLYIMDGTNKVYEDLLNTGIQKIQPEAFIMHKNQLIYIKNKSELKVLSL